MFDLIHLPFTIALGIPVVWTSVFSTVLAPRVRGLRNLGILACHVCLIAFLSVPGWRRGVGRATVLLAVLPVPPPPYPRSNGRYSVGL